MPISSGHLRALTTERLVAARPTFAPIPVSSEAAAHRRPFLSAVIDGAPITPAVMHLPDAMSIVPLDMGRVHLPDALRLFGWEPGTHLDWSIVDDHLQLVAAENGKRALDSQGRFMLQVAARRRMGINEYEQVLVITSALPTPHVLIYPRTSLVSLSWWGHQLAFAQRNGADLIYSVAFLIWVFPFISALAAWAIAGATTIRELGFTDKLLTVEAHLSFFIVAAMFIMAIATATWWAALAQRAPWFLAGTAAGSRGTILPINLLFAGVFMLAGVGLGSSGAIGIQRSRRSLQLS